MTIGDLWNSAVNYFGGWLSTGGSVTGSGGANYTPANGYGGLVSDDNVREFNQIVSQQMANGFEINVSNRNAPHLSQVVTIENDNTDSNDALIFINLPAMSRNMTLHGADGRADTMYGADGYDKLYGGSGADRLSGRGGGDFLDGGAGADRIWGGSGMDVLRLTAGDVAGLGKDDSADVAKIAAGASVKIGFFGNDDALDVVDPRIASLYGLKVHYHKSDGKYWLDETSGVTIETRDGATITVAGDLYRGGPDDFASLSDLMARAKYEAIDELNLF